MKQAQNKNTSINRILRFAGWLLAALVLLAGGNAALGLIKSGRYVLDMFIASLLWPLALLMATRQRMPLFWILLVFFSVMSVYALIAVGLGLLGYGNWVEVIYPWPAELPIHLLPGGLQTLSVLLAAWSKRRVEQK